MKMSVARTILGVGLLCGPADAETNVVFSKMLADGRAVEVSETTISYPQPSKVKLEELYDFYQRAQGITNRADLIARVDSAMKVPTGYRRYELRTKSIGDDPIVVWTGDSHLVGDNDRESRWIFYDVVAKASKIAILHSSHVAVVIDVVDGHGGTVKSSQSHTLGVTKVPGAVTSGRLVWIDDDVYALVRSAQTLCSVFHLSADGKCTRLEMRPDTRSRGAID